MRDSKYSLIVMGSGAAGLYSALKISKRKDFLGEIIILTKSPLGESNTRYAQGGIAGVISQNKNDSVEKHIEDTLKAGAGLCDENVVRYISENSEKAINSLVSLGLNFDKDETGDFSCALAGAHSVNRVLHYGEDSTGMGIIDVLKESVRQAKNIHIKEKTMVVELLVNDKSECIGVIAFDKNTNEYEVFYSDNVIISTGGIGQIYKYTTNPYGATGDGIALAYESGAEVCDMEFIQFHPTALALNPENKNRYLISESVRGEGAKLVNHKGDEFMSKYSEQGELASRDVVSRAIICEMELENSSNEFLDVSVLGSGTIEKRFPSIQKKCRTNGIDITKEPIPVAPAAHYCIGGVKATLGGKTNIKGLYAIGEAASTGFHGANRLASNSLLECIVCADKLAEDIEFSDDVKDLSSDKSIANLIELYSAPIDNSEYECKSLIKNLNDIMWKNVGIIRSEKSLFEAIDKIKELQKDFKRTRKCLNSVEYEYRNMLTVSLIIAEAALARKNSIGAHYRTDFINN